MKLFPSDTWVWPLTIIGTLLAFFWIIVGLQDVVKFAEEMRKVHAPMQALNHEDIAESHIALIHRTTELLDEVSKLKEKVAILEGRIVGNIPAGYHRDDHEEWCIVFLRDNEEEYPDLKCPDPRTLPRYIEMTSITD